LALRLRLPNALADGPQGKYLTLPGVRFGYGQESVEAALEAGTALSYRFLHDTKGWRVFVTATVAAPECTTRRQAGALGVDINADHLALAEIDRFGNLVRPLRIDCHTYGKTQDQARATIGDAVKVAVAIAREAGKPLAIEKLDFAKKKAALGAEHPRRSRALSSFAYSAIGVGLRAAALRAGVEVLAVNPAYTSTIGAVNHAQPHGISIHQGAAFAIARRALGWRERPTVRHGVAPVPVRNGGHVTLDLPVRNRSGHVWSFWSRVRRRLTAAHVAHFRSGGLKGPPSPLPRAIPALGPTRILPAGLRHANRPQHCSADVLEDIPW
jgi:IS605 OrfB family transposase